MRCLVSYDIADNGRRRRVVKRLERCAVRVQYSVFIGDLSEREWGGVWADLTHLSI